MSSVTDLYQEMILDHSRSPRHFGRPARHTHEAEGLNPLCGDHYHVFLDVDEGGTIRDVAFEGSGCAISKASASLMSEALSGRTREEAESLFEQFVSLAKGDAGAAERPLGKLKVFEGVWKFPSRVKCAVLCWHAVHSALQDQAVVSTE